MKSRFKTSLSLAVLGLTLVFPLVAQPAAAQDGTKTLAITTKSEDAKRHFWMGMKDFDNVFVSRAAGHFAAALKADPELAIAEVMHAWLVPGLRGEERQMRMDAAIGKIATLATPELLFASAARQQRAGNQADARALFAATADLVPDDPHVAYRHAVLVGGGGSPERIAALTSFTDRFPDFAAAFNTLAYAQWAAGDKASARQNVTKYAELLPDHPNSHDSVAEMMQFTGLYAQAVKHYEMAISLDANYFAGYTGLAEVRSLVGDGTGARAALAEAQKHASSDVQRAAVTRYVANTYFFEGNGAKGLSTLKEAATALGMTNGSGQAAQAHRELAVAEALYGSADNIPMHIAKATELASASVGNHSWAALAYGLAGDANGAREATRAFDKATNNNNAFTHTLDGMVALISGKHAAAEKELLASGLNDSWANAFMVRCQKEMGNTAEALALEREILADHQYTVVNFGYTLSRLTLMENGTGHIRAGLEMK